MNAFLVYLLVTAICTGVFFLCFRLLMRKETSFGLNRATLLLIILLPLAIPFIPLPRSLSEQLPESLLIRPEQLTVNRAMDTPEHLPTAYIAEQNTGTEIKRSVSTDQNNLVPTDNSAFRTTSPAESPGYPVSVTLILFCIYLSGVVISAVISLRGIIRAFALMKQGQVYDMGFYKLIVLPTEGPAWSLGRRIVISQSDFRDNAAEIILHEQAHMQLRHLFDLILLTAAQTLFWFNPVIHLIKRDMREIHEFQADAYALSRGVEVTKYQMLIIRKCVGETQFALATNFNHYCQIKKRITMMNRSKKSSVLQWKSLVYLPLLALLLVLFSGKGVAQSAEDEKSVAQTDAVTWFKPLPKGWFVAGNQPNSYKMGIDPSSSAATIKSIQPQINGFGTIMQSCYASKYLGKRVRMSGFVKSQDVKDWAGLWFRIDSDAMVTSYQCLGFDNMQDRAIKGTTDWKKYEIVLNVPQDAANLAFGTLLSGTGQIWFKDFSFEVVDDSVPVTNMNRPKATLPSEPINLSF